MENRNYLSWQWCYASCCSKRWRFAILMVAKFIISMKLFPCLFLMSFDQQFLMQFLLVIAILIWIYAILRVARDISQRTNNGWMQFLSVILLLLGTPCIGLPIYFLIRPINTQHDLYRQEQLLCSAIACVYCNQRNDKAFEFCTFCGEKLKQSCKNCHNAYALSYEYCPFCGLPNLED